MFDLSSYNTFKLKVSAQHGREVSEISDLLTPLNEPYIILGGGSDVLFVEDFKGTVLINRIKGMSIEPQGHDEFLVRVGGGEILDEVIAKLLKQGIVGLENLSLIPGTVGAAPIQNVGAYGVEIGERIAYVEAVDLKTQRICRFSQAECCFGYRSSIFKRPEYKHYFITHVVFKLSKYFKPVQSYAGLQSLEFKDAQAMRERIISLRNEKLPDPKRVGNAGSFFKNPYIKPAMAQKLKDTYGKVPLYPQDNGDYKVAAGWLIDKSRCRGIKHGQVGTWGQQALVIVNLGDAKPHEVVAIAKYVSTEVKQEFGIELTPEVCLYGRNGEVEWDQI